MHQCAIMGRGKSGHTRGGAGRKKNDEKGWVAEWKSYNLWSTLRKIPCWLSCCHSFLSIVHTAIRLPLDSNIQFLKLKDPQYVSRFLYVCVHDRNIKVQLPNMFFQAVPRAGRRHKERQKCKYTVYISVGVMVCWAMPRLLYTVHDMYLQRVHIWSLVLALRTT